MTRTQLHSSIAARTGEPVSVIRRIGFSLCTGTRKEPSPADLHLVLHCPFCRRQVPYPGRSRDGSEVLGECHDCDVYFAFDDHEVFPATTRPAGGPELARSRYLPT
jgi:hypothetical protein